MTKRPTNLEAAEQTLEALRIQGRLEAIDQARVVALRTLAAAVDADPANASLWREYRAAEATLRETDDGSEDYGEILAELFTKSRNRTN
jgi:hypothetical protein